jgi:hypothetical protein
MDGLCQACFCAIGPAEIPLCAVCYAEFLKLPVDVRMVRMADLARNEHLSRVARAANSLVDLIELSSQRSRPCAAT